MSVGRWPSAKADCSTRRVGFSPTGRPPAMSCGMGFPEGFCAARTPCQTRTNSPTSRRGPEWRPSIVSNRRHHRDRTPWPLAPIPRFHESGNVTKIPLRVSEGRLGTIGLGLESEKRRVLRLASPASMIHQKLSARPHRLVQRRRHWRSQKQSRPEGCRGRSRSISFP